MKDYKELITDEMVKAIYENLKSKCWIDCPGCNKRMNDMKGFGSCYECKKKGTQNEPFNINEVTGF